LDGQELTNQDYISFLRNPVLEEKVLKDLELNNRVAPDMTIEELDRALNISREDSSNIVSLSYKAPTPE